MIECPRRKCKGQEKKGLVRTKQENIPSAAPVQVSQQKHSKSPSTPWMGRLVPAIHERDPAQWNSASWLLKLLEVA